MKTPVWLYGTLGGGRRKRILGMTLQAEPLPQFPCESGVLLVTGEDFVQKEYRTPLLHWIQEPGRVLVVVPPLEVGTQNIPVRWTVHDAFSCPGGGTGLAAFLAREVQYRLQGDFLTDQLRDMQFNRQTLAVGYYRPRISTGILAITVLPIWSLRTVDRPDLVQNWISRLFALSGKPRRSEKEKQKKPQLTPYHYSLLLHLSSQKHTSLPAALDTLESSSVFHITREHGSRLCEDLIQLGLINEARLTDTGREALDKSPYAIYLSALKETKP